MLGAVEDMARRLLTEEEVAAVMKTCRRVRSSASQPRVHSPFSPVHSVYEHFTHQLWVEVSPRVFTDRMLVALAVRSGAVGGEPDSPPAGPAGPARKAAAAEGGQVRAAQEGDDCGLFDIKVSRDLTWAVVPSVDLIPRLKCRIYAYKQVFTSPACRFSLCPCV